MYTTTSLDAKDYLKIALFVIGFALLAFFTSRLPEQPEESPYERVQTKMGVLQDEFPDEALLTLRDYVYQYTGDYDNVSQDEADAAYEEISEFCDSLYDIFYDVLD